MTERALTELQEKFLSVLFNEADGDFAKAAEMAGYVGSHHAVVKSLKREITELAELYLAKNGIKAAKSVIDVMINPTDIGNQQKLAAANSVLDRIGVIKKDQLNITADEKIGIFILPPKDVKDGIGE